MIHNCFIVAIVTQMRTTPDCSVGLGEASKFRFDFFSIIESKLLEFFSFQIIRIVLFRMFNNRIDSIDSNSFTIRPSLIDEMLLFHE